MTEVVVVALLRHTQADQAQAALSQLLVFRSFHYLQIEVTDWKNTRKFIGSKRARQTESNRQTHRTARDQVALSFSALLFHKGTVLRTRLFTRQLEQFKRYVNLVVYTFKHC